MPRDWETDVLWPSVMEKLENKLDALGWRYEILERGRLNYIVIKGQTEEEVSKLFKVEG